MRASSCVLSLLMIATPALANNSVVVAQLVAAWQEGNTASVIAGADRALAAPSLERSDRISVLLLRGAALAVDDRLDDAAVAFKQAFALDPDAELPPYLRRYPPLRGMFEAARSAWRTDTETFMHEHHASEIAGIRVDVKPPALPRGGRSVDFDVDLVDPGALGRRVLFSYKRRSDFEYTTIAKPVASRLRFSIPDQLTESRAPYVLDYHLVLRADNGYDLAAIGDVKKPRSLDVAAGQRPVPPQPIYRRWWFWTGVAAAAGAFGFVIYRAQDVGPQQGTTTIIR